ncbi:MAG TPA: XRE family transcriptional regulator [Chitinophagaceae bacterium]|nr:XRE family transcriptional regulator [Chitinophagaceae bacterium]
MLTAKHLTKSETKYNRIKAVLAEKGVSNKELAAKLNVTEGTVSNWCRNIKQPKIETLFEIAKVLNVDVRLLLVVQD